MTGEYLEMTGEYLEMTGKYLEMTGKYLVIAGKYFEMTVMCLLMRVLQYCHFERAKRVEKSQQP